jgi:hypothetical protein
MVFHPTKDQNGWEFSRQIFAEYLFFTLVKDMLCSVPIGWHSAKVSFT